jgi:signal peptidase I
MTSNADIPQAGADEGTLPTSSAAAVSPDSGASAAEPVIPVPPRRRSGALGLLRETVLVVGIALVLSLIIKTFLVQAFYIPSGSMENTLLTGDKVIVSKLTPGPFDLKRGDIVVFKDPGGWLDPTVPAQRSKLGGAIHDGLTFIGLLPNDADDHLIKRIIGLPGDHVVCCTAQGLITVNGVPIHEPYIYPGNAPSDKNFDITVPAGKIWVMGDHREISRDSRFNDPSGNGSDGSVPIDLVVGRAVVIVWPVSRAGWLGVPNSTFAKVPAPTAGK